MHLEGGGGIAHLKVFFEKEISFFMVKRLLREVVIRGSVREVLWLRAGAPYWPPPLSEAPGIRVQAAEHP